MGKSYFFFSQKQKDHVEKMIKRGVYGHSRSKCEVYIDGQWHEYNNSNKSGNHNSNWDDVVFLGVSGTYDIRVNGHIQSERLKKEIKKNPEVEF